MCRQVLTLAGLSDWQIGKTRAFLRAGQLAALEVGSAQVSKAPLNSGHTSVVSGAWLNARRTLSYDMRSFFIARFQACTAESTPVAHLHKEHGIGVS